MKRGVGMDLWKKMYNSFVVEGVLSCAFKAFLQKEIHTHMQAESFIPAYATVAIIAL